MTPLAIARELRQWAAQLRTRNPQRAELLERAAAAIEAHETQPRVVEVTQ